MFIDKEQTLVLYVLPKTIVLLLNALSVVKISALQTYKYYEFDQTFV